MANLLTPTGLVADTYTPYSAALPPSGDLLVTLADWLEHRAGFDAYRAAGAGKIGIILDSDADVAALAEQRDHFDLVALRFTKFSDGRGFSQAYLLRQRYGYHGPLRAIGPLLRDQLFYLARVGFDSVSLRPGQDEAAALRSWQDFSVRYQGAVDQTLPLFARENLERAA